MSSEPAEYRLIYAETYDDAKMIFAFLAPFHAACGTVPLNPGKALAEIVNVISEGVALMVIKDGVILGSIGMIPGEYWYSDHPLMLDRWLYVMPQHRDGIVMKMLLEEVARIADNAGADAQVTINNPTRRRGPRGPVEKIASLLHYETGGMMLRPSGGENGRLQ